MHFCDAAGEFGLRVGADVSDRHLHNLHWSALLDFNHQLQLLGHQGEGNLYHARRTGVSPTNRGSLVGYVDVIKSFKPNMVNFVLLI